MAKWIFGIFIVLLFPIAAQAQTDKHASIGASVGAHQYSDNDRFQHGVGISFLYRVSRHTGGQNGWSWGPSVSLDLTGVDYHTDTGGDDVKLGRLKTIPVMVGYGPGYRHNRTKIGLTLEAGASFNKFSIGPDGRAAYDRVGTPLENVDVKNSFIAKPSAGLWYDLSSRFGLHTGLSYFYDRPKASITAGGATTTSTWNADHFGLSFGAVYGLF